MENKNFIIAMVLSILIMILWSEFFMPKPEVSEEEISETEETESLETEKPKPGLEKIRPKKTDSLEHAEESEKIVVSKGISHPEKTGKIRSSHLMAEYSTKQGKLQSLLITDKKYVRNNNSVDLIQGLFEDTYFPAFSSVFKKEPVYKIAASTKNSVTMEFSSEGITEHKIISINDPYEITVAKKISNNTDSPIVYEPLLTIESQFKNEELFNSLRESFSIYLQFSGEGFVNVDETEDLKKALADGHTIEWAGINYGYFFMGVLADDKRKMTLDGIIEEDKNYTKLIVSPGEKLSIDSGETKTASFSMYFGPKEISKLKSAENTLENAVDYGWLSFLAKPLLSVLNFFYSYVGNYGVSIILLTFAIKLLLWPLNTKSFKSMNKMKKLQPKINALKEKHGKDKETLNRETMKLYQKEGVNPLGGCLPMFIQMPVYIALYYMIKTSVELYNAPFLPVWLTDLSSPDPYYIIPVALGLTMFIQQSMMPQQGDNKQAQMLKYVMPIMFAAISWSLPSGLTMYWFTNTLLGIMQQFYIRKKYS